MGRTADDQAPAGARDVAGRGSGAAVGSGTATAARGPGEAGVVPRWLRMFGMLAMMCIFVTSALADSAHRHHGARLGVEVAALCVMFALVLIFGLDDRTGSRRRLGMWVMLTFVLAIGVALPLYGGPGWLGTTAVASAMVGRFLPPRPTVVIIAVLVAYTVALPFLLHTDTSLVLFALLPIAGAVFPYQTQRRMRIIGELRETRAELARVAVAEERLRIARDLHDLLGHSLSVITLKSELAGRLVDADPARARSEMAEVEAVARRSLTEVREAVTAYRRPTLGAELAAARGALASAGIEARVDASAGALPGEVDALLAWAVREGVTNVIRHSDARRCTIRLAAGREVALEVLDDGAGVPDHAAGDIAGDVAGGGRAAGSGLAGLTERAGQLGGALEAGRPASGGFRLRVTIPLPDPSSGERGTGSRSPGAGPGAGGRTRVDADRGAR